MVSLMFLGIPGLTFLGVLAHVRADSRIVDLSPVEKSSTKAEDSAMIPDLTMPVVSRSDYWIGAQVSPVPQALLSHFGINEERPAGETTEKMKTDVNHSAKPRLIYIERVVPESPAEKAGLKRGDVLLKFGGQNIGSLSDLVAQVEKAKDTGQNVVLIREGKTMELNITPALRPEEAKQAMQAAPGMPGWNDLRSVPGGDGDEMMRRMMRHFQEEMQQMQRGFSEKRPRGDDDWGDEGIALSAPPEKQELPQAQSQASTVRSAARVQAANNSIDRLEVSETVDTEGKTVIHVKQTIQTGDSKDENVWEVEKIDELPKELQDEVKGMLGTKLGT